MVPALSKTLVYMTCKYTTLQHGLFVCDLDVIIVILIGLSCIDACNNFRLFGLYFLLAAFVQLPHGRSPVSSGYKQCCSCMQ